MNSVLNEAYMTPDTPFHEILAHPIIRALKKSKPQLYQSYGILHRAEYELLRVLASLLACPMPLLLGQIHVDRNPQ